MSLKALFKKPVDRPIDPVIKADDEASLRHELEEYVLTDEVSKRLDTFFDAYNNYTDANGVWRGSACEVVQAGVATDLGLPGNEYTLLDPRKR